MFKILAQPYTGSKVFEPANDLRPIGMSKSEGQFIIQELKALVIATVRFEKPFGESKRGFRRFVIYNPYQIYKSTQSKYRFKAEAAKILLGLLFKNGVLKFVNNTIKINEDNDVLADLHRELTEVEPLELEEGIEEMMTYKDHIPKGFLEGLEASLKQK